MARKALSLTAGSTVIGAENFGSPHSDNDPLNAATTATDSGTVTTADTLALTTDKALVDANVSTLVADGAAPTQAHVTALNTNWTTMKTDMAALHTAIAALQADLATRPASVDVVLSFDAVKVTSVSSLRRAVFQLLEAAKAAGLAP